MSRRGLGYTLAEERALLTFLNSRLKASASNDMNFKFTARDWKAAAARVNSIKTGGKLRTTSSCESKYMGKLMF